MVRTPRALFPHTIRPRHIIPRPHRRRLPPRLPPPGPCRLKLLGWGHLHGWGSFRRDINHWRRLDGRKQLHHPKLTLRIYPGVQTPNGEAVARFTTDALEQSDAPVGVDVIGVGASAYDALKVVHKNTFPINNGSKSDATDKTRRYGFTNLRAESYWKLREALDPASGEDIALPPSRELRVDLCAPRYKALGGKYQLESKEDIKKRTGRSPDYGDAVVMAWYIANRRKGFGFV